MKIYIESIEIGLYCNSIETIGEWLIIEIEKI